MGAINIAQWYVDDPRLRMSAVERVGVRIIGTICLVILITTAVMLLLGGIEHPNAFCGGLLLALVLIDYGIHANDPRALITMRVRERIKRGERMNAADFIPKRSFAIIASALERAVISRKNVYVHILERLCGTVEVREALFRMNVSPDEFQKKAEEVIRRTPEETAGTDEELRRLSALIMYACVDAIENNDIAIDPHDLFAALFHVANQELVDLFTFFEIQEADLKNALIFGKFKNITSRIGSLTGPTNRAVQKRIMNRAWTARPTPTLDKYSTDLTAYARSNRLGLLVGHRAEVDRLIDVLSRPLKGSALLAGEVGSGKHTIITYLAYRIIHDQVPPALFDKRLIELSLGSLVAGAAPSELQARTKKVVEEIVRAGNVILYIPELHNMLRTTGTEFMNAADILLPYITGGQFQIIGSTSMREYKKFIEPSSDFANAFEAIHIDPITEDEAARLLSYEAIILERVYKSTVSYKAIKRAVSIAARYIKDKQLPSSAENLLKEALAEADNRKAHVLLEDDIIRIAERKIKVPIHKATSQEAHQLIALEDEIHKRYIDQEAAVKAIARALREYRAGLTRKGGPIASFLFVGPTGVGKTELSKILAELQFGSAGAMVRFDMSEFQQKQAITRFIGSADGDVSGQITEAIRLKPFALILLDEFEKAHPDILNLFLQVLDDGRLTDGLGNTIDFTNTIIIATSNAHSEYIKAEVESGKGIEGISAELKKKLTSVFKPELLNRFSEIVVFRTLTLEHLQRIATVQLQELVSILDSTHGVTLAIDPAAITLVAQLGYDPAFGARPMRAVISERIKAKLADAILQDQVHRGAHLRLAIEGDSFVFKTDN